MVLFLARYGFGGMEMIDVRGHRWDSLYTKWLEHPSQLTWDGEGQKSSLICYFRQNIQWGTALRRVDHTWVVAPPR